MQKKFKKGNKTAKGRPKGSKNKTTLLLKATLETEKDNLITKAIEMAKEGNVQIMNKLLDKLLPNAQPKDEEGNFIMPEITFNVINN